MKELSGETSIILFLLMGMQYEHAETDIGEIIYKSAGIALLW
jgi:hypothetical protein